MRLSAAWRMHTAAVLPASPPHCSSPDLRHAAQTEASKVPETAGFLMALQVYSLVRSLQSFQIDCFQSDSVRTVKPDVHVQMGTQVSVKKKQLK